MSPITARGHAMQPPGRRNFVRMVHPVAGAIAMLTIATFWLSTALSELFASEATVLAVKSAIPWGFLLLAPALAATGGAGYGLSMGQRQGLVGAKLSRMPFIAANGILVLIPSAFFLASKARSAEFDALFYAVQALELIAGATNFGLLAMGMRDGLRLTQWRRKNSLPPQYVYSSRLVARKQVAELTLAFRVSKPEGFAFAAGQAVYVSLPGLENMDTKGGVRTFSIASAPQDQELEIVTRLTDSSFKRDLTAMFIGSAVQIEGPYGDLALHNDAARPAVFIAGGIGVTPFRSMILDAIRRGLPQQLFLFYSNRGPDGAAFLDDLRKLEQNAPRFKLIAIFTGESGAKLDGDVEHGHITAGMIAKYVGDTAAPVYYVAGPASMVAATEALLRDGMDVRAENVRMEKFPGY